MEWNFSKNGDSTEQIFGKMAIQRIGIWQIFIASKSRQFYIQILFINKLATWNMRCSEKVCLTHICFFILVLPLQQAVWQSLHLIVLYIYLGHFNKLIWKRFILLGLSKWKRWSCGPCQKRLANLLIKAITTYDNVFKQLSEDICLLHGC